MVLLLRFLAVLALAIQMALGPMHLALDVCHGEVQWSVIDGTSCCAAEHGESTADGTQPEGPTVEDDECSKCYQLEIAEVEDPILVASSVDIPAQTEFVADVVSKRSNVPLSKVWCASTTRGPPDALTPTGLMLGVFPLRI